MRARILSTFLMFRLSFLVAMPLAAAQKQGKGSATGSEEFFIISSVEMAKQQLFLKRPTEVTELMRVSDATVCLDGHGTGFPCKNLRAGDTVFVTSRRMGGAASTAVRIRIGPMTVEEVHHRFMSHK